MKILICVMAGLLLCSMFVVRANFGQTSKEASVPSTILSDDFEAYPAGTFPYTGGWELWFDGAGSEHQIINDGICASPTKSLQLVGQSHWAAFAAKRFTTNATLVGFQVSIRVEESGSGEGIYDFARVAFTKQTSSVTTREYAPIFFEDNGTIVVGGKVVQSYAAGEWYKVRLIIDRPNEKCSVWIDDVLRADNIDVTVCGSPPETSHPSYEFEAFSVSQCYDGVKIFADDVEILAEEPSLPEIDDVQILPICPAPYVPSNTTRTNEPVAVKANITEAEEALLKFRSLNGEWFNVSMVYDGAEGLWAQTIPGQCGNCTVEFFIEVWDSYGRSITSQLYSFNVKLVLPGDIDGDGTVDIYDAIILADNFE
jgi:hypothetical protein